MPTRPNIILIQAEDTGCAQGCYGNLVARTPHIDSLAAEGCRYSRAYATAPVCAPSRSATVMGKTAFSQGSHHMRSDLVAPPRLFTHELRDAGYYVNWGDVGFHVCWANKTDFNFQPPVDFAEDSHCWLEELAEGRLPQDRPFFLYTNLEVTHESTMWPSNYAERVAPQLPEHERIDPASVPVPAYLPDTPEVRADIARHYDSLTLQDRQVGRILEALEQSGQKDNTIVLYMADHGRGLYREKRWCYDAGLHVPFILSGPGLPCGRVSHEVVSNLDLAPTLLSLAGVPVPEGYQGRILLGPEVQPPRPYAFAGRDRMDECFDRVRACMSERYHYIRNDFPSLPYASRLDYLEEQLTTQIGRDGFASGTLDAKQSLFFRETKPPEELYDTLADPNCVDDLADEADYQDILAEHRRALADFLAATGDFGQTPERALIESGHVRDLLPDYTAHIRPLPKAYQIGPQPAPIEMPQET